MAFPWFLMPWDTLEDCGSEQASRTMNCQENRKLRQRLELWIIEHCFFFSLEQSFSHLKLFWQGWIHVLTLFYSSYNHPLTVMKGNSSDISKPRQWGSFSPLTNWVMGKSVRCPLPQFGGGRGDILSIKWMNELRMCKSITHIIKQIENE